MTKEEKQLLKIYQKTEDENIKKVLAKLLDDDGEEKEKDKEEPKEEPKEEAKKEPKKEHQKEEKEDVQKEKEKDPKEEELSLFQKKFEELSKDFEVVVKELNEIKKASPIGVKAKSKEPSKEYTFQSVWEKINARNH